MTICIKLSINIDNIKRNFYLFKIVRGVVNDTLFSKYFKYFNFENINTNRSDRDKLK